MSHELEVRDGGVYAAASESPTPQPVGEESPAPRTPETSVCRRCGETYGLRLGDAGKHVTNSCTPAATTPNTQEIEKLLRVMDVEPALTSSAYWGARSAILDFCNAQTAELASLRADAKRLDWIQEMSEAPDGHLKLWNGRKALQWFRLELGGHPELDTLSLRSAIDAAMGDVTNG